LATIAIEWTGANVATLLSTYSPDPTLIIPLFTGVTISQENTGNLYTVTISDLSFLVPGACTGVPTLAGDVWGTQANSNNPTVHCVSTNIPLSIVNPLVTGVINCAGTAGPRTYNLDITTTDVVGFNVIYKLYLDDGVLTGGVTTFSSADQLIFTSSTLSVSASTPIDINNAAYNYGAGQSQRTVWVEVRGGTLPNAIIAEIRNNCDAILPVRLVKFQGDLLDNSITLSWVTAEESGSSKFSVERSVDMKEFISIGDVTAAGNSRAKKNYQFLDMSPSVGNNYYRLKQLDYDGSFEYSRTIAVANNEGSLAFELLGNPAQNGEIRFLFKNQDLNVISLTNMKGQSIKYTLAKDGNTYIVKPKTALVSGVYILSLKNGQNHLIKKILFL